MTSWALALGLLTLLGPAAASAHPRPAPPAKARHVVRPGDTLSLLAKRYGLEVKALAEANRLASPDRIRAGQALVIPAKAGAILDPAPVPPPGFVLAPPDLNGRAPGFGWPVEGPVSSPFGRRRSGWHAGIDIKADVGTPVFAGAAGTVYHSGWEKRYGLVVKIQHVDGFVTVYAHQLQLFVEAGDEVYRGQVIGTVGRTGRASAYHLHFEIRNNGKVYDPLHFLPAREAATEPEAATQPEDELEDDE